MQDYRAEAGRFVARLVSPIASNGVQIHHVTMQPGCRSVGRPHPLGAQEFFYALTGTAHLQIEDEVVEIPAGSLVQFPRPPAPCLREPRPRAPGDGDLDGGLPHGMMTGIASVRCPVSGVLDATVLMTCVRG